MVISDGIQVFAYDIQGVGTEITPSAGDLSGGVVTFTDLNGVLVMNSQSDGPFFWDTGQVLPEDRLMTELPGWDSTWRCKDMRAYRYYLVALGMTEDSVEFPHKVRWSNSAQEGSLPTEWIAANSNDAGADLIGETAGPIVGGTLVRDALWIVKEDAVYEMRWIGAEYVMQLSRMKGTTVGTRVLNGFAEMKGGLVIFTTSDVLLFDGNQAISLADQRVRSGLFNAISEEYWERSRVFVHPETSQLIVAGVGAGYQNLSGAMIYNWEENTWSTRQLHYSYGFDSAFVTTSTGLPTWDELGTPLPIAAGPDPMWLPGGTWDEQVDGSWNKGIYQPSTRDIIVYESNDTDTEWWVSLVALVDTNFDGTPKTCLAERLCIPIEGADGLAMVTEVWPELQASIPVTISVGGQQAVDGEITWDSGHVVEPGKTNVVTPRVTGRFISFRVESFGNGRWELGALTFNWQRAGER
jgi:hypothetical protein